MNGLNLRQGFGGAPVIVSSPAQTAYSTSPAVATYGPSGASVANAGPGVVNSSPASWAIYVGIGALILLVYMRQSLPRG